MPADSPTPDSPSALRVGLSAGKSLIGGLMLGIALAILLGFTTTFYTSPGSTAQACQRQPMQAVRGP